MLQQYFVLWAGHLHCSIFTALIQQTLDLLTFIHYKFYRIITKMSQTLLLPEQNSSFKCSWVSSLLNMDFYFFYTNFASLFSIQLQTRELIYDWSPYIAIVLSKISWTCLYFLVVDFFFLWFWEQNWSFIEKWSGRSGLLLPSKPFDKYSDRGLQGSALSLSSRIKCV